MSRSHRRVGQEVFRLEISVLHCREDIRLVRAKVVGIPILERRLVILVSCFSEFSCEEPEPKRKPPAKRSSSSSECKAWG